MDNSIIIAQKFNYQNHLKDLSKNFGKEIALTVSNVFVLIQELIDITPERILINYKKEGIHGNTGDIRDARKIAIMAVKKTHLRLSLNNLGKIFNRDHSSIIHSFKTHQNYMESKSSQDVFYQAIFQKVLNGVFIPKKEDSKTFTKRLYSYKEVVWILELNGVKNPIFI